MLNRLLGGLGRTLIFAGIVLLLFVGYQLWGTKLDEESHQADLTRSLGRSVGLSTSQTSDSADPDAIAQEITAKLAHIDPTTAEAATAPSEGQPGGFIEIPKIGLRSKTFVEGVSKADLRKGPGHYPGTPLPGNAGNASIAGHRTTYGAPFNRIDELVPGDKVVTYTPQGKFVYEVMESPANRRSGKSGGTWGPGWFAVNPNDVSVLAPTDDNRLTLTACHPKYSAKLRIIVQAKLVAEPAEAPTATTVPPTTGNSETVFQPKTETAEDMIAGDPNELTPSLLFLAVVVALWLGSMGVAALLRRRERRGWPVYVFTVVASIAPLWFCFVHMDRFLPSF
ncbi:MAG: class E sortase [Acidimicrobiales bacterium]